jgi:hypothetical protein
VIWIVLTLLWFPFAAIGTAFQRSLSESDFRAGQGWTDEDDGPWTYYQQLEWKKYAALEAAKDRLALHAAWQWGSLATMPPITLLLFGFAVVWVAAGFRSKTVPEVTAKQQK